MEQFHPIALLVPEIKELLKEKNYSLLKQVLRETSCVEYADVWGKFDEDERVQIFKLLPASSAIKLFEVLEIEDQRNLMSKLSEESVGPLLEGMASPDLAKIFHKMNPRTVKKMTSLIKRQEALAHIDLVMKYPEHSAGSLMHPEYIKLSPRLTSKQALLVLTAVSRPNQKEHLYALYVTDDDGKVLGSLTLQDLLSAPEDEKLVNFMSSIEGVKIRPETDQEEVAKLFAKYNLTSAPVVDEAGKLLGVVTAKDMISIVRQEATEDIAKMVGTKAKDVMEESVFRIVGFRMPWLVVTVFGGLMISAIIKFYEPTLAKVIALASFSPLIAGMGGNVGSQSATIMVRNIALGQFGQRKRRTVLKETSVGLLLGAIYGVALGGIAYLMYGSQYGYFFSFVVAVGMITSMTVAATMGALGPLILEKMGIDPATATGPLITTTTDIISNLTYFSLATALLTSF